MLKAAKANPQFIQAPSIFRLVVERVQRPFEAVPGGARASRSDKVK